MNKTVWNPKHPTDAVSENHAIVVGSKRNGRATLLWGVPPPPPPPFTVTASAPDYIETKGYYNLVGSANYPASGWKWELSENGGTTWSVWATTKTSTFLASAGEDITLYWRLSARRSDGVTDYALASTTICTVSGGCNPGPIQ